MKIYVATHRPCDRPLPEAYEYMQVNAAQNEHFCPLTDDMGEDNISGKNPFYCELTAMYWVWKNDAENDVVGMAHYRRFLTKRALSASEKHYVSEKDAAKWLDRYDMIASRQQKFGVTVEEQLWECTRAQDIALLRQTVERISPEYLEAYDAVMQGSKTFLCNLFIAKKRVWDAYCTWLFSILTAMEERVDMTGYSAQEKRLYGYLAERLFTVYVRKNKLRVKCVYTHIVGTGAFRKIRNKIRQIFCGK